LDDVMNDVIAASMFILLTDALYCICIHEKYVAWWHQQFWSFWPAYDIKF